MCWNVHVFENRWKGSEENWGLLSDLTVKGIPCPAKMDMRCSIMADDVVRDNLEKESTAKRY